MRSLAILVGLLSVGVEPAARAADPPPGFPKFTAQEIDTGLKIGYAVQIADINGDGKPDILVADQFQVVWYENPTWKKRVILNGKTDNVCIAVLDIDGDGQLDIVLGAGWQPANTAIPGTLQWLKRGKTLDEEWTLYPIPCDEPTVHRVRCLDIDGDGKPEIILAPLQGRGATSKGNWVDGRPVRMLAYKVPAEPTKPASWKPIVLSDELHVVHNFCPGLHGGYARQGMSLFAASYEGVSMIYPEGQGERWTTVRVHEADQRNPMSNRGASEIKRSRDKLGLIATIEPWHGNQVVVYAPGKPDPRQVFSYDRHVIDSQLRWGHAVWFADLDGDGVDELIIGVRDDPNPKAGDKHTERRGVRIYKNADGKGTKWERFILEDGGVAVEDLAAADLDGDGRIDIVAVGRQTGNARIYWNKGKAP